MLKRTDIVFIEHYNDACDIFGNDVEIKGGVNYFLIDVSYTGTCLFNNVSINLNRYDVLIDNPLFYSIIDKIINMNIQKLSQICMGRCFGIETNDEKKGIIKQLKINNNRINIDYVKCHVSQLKQKDLISSQHDFYYPISELKGKDYNYWKVITARAAHGHRSGFGNIFIGTPNEVHTGSYISFRVNSELEAKSLTSYLKCKLANFLLSVRKNSQDLSEKTCEWIPLPPLDQLWSDDDIYAYFEFSETQILLLRDIKIPGFNSAVSSDSEE